MIALARKLVARRLLAGDFDHGGYARATVGQALSEPEPAALHTPSFNLISRPRRNNVSQII
jgi:hypothetical protein